MKKIIIASFTLLISNFSFAQFSFVDGDGNEIPDNTEVIFTTANTSEAAFPFRIINISDEPIEVKIKSTNIINSNGANFQVCYGGTCYDNIMVNGIYPEYEFEIEPGEDNGPGDYFRNNNVSESENMTFEFSIYAVGFEENAITFTYKYEPQLSINDIDKLTTMGIHINNTLVKNTFGFEANDAGVVEIYDLNGRLVSTSKYDVGAQNIEMSALNAAIYIAKFNNVQGNTSTIKIVKQ